MIRGINHLTWNVHNIDEAFSFYIDLLGMKPIMKSSQSAYLLAGNCWCAITLGQHRQDQRYDHIAFDILPNDYEACIKRLKRAHVTEWKENSTEGASFYFLDPSGNKLELHYSTLEDRIKQGKKYWGSNITWYV